MGINLLSRPDSALTIVLKLEKAEQDIEWLLVDETYLEHIDSNVCDSLVQLHSQNSDSINRSTRCERIDIGEVLKGMVDMNKIQIAKGEDTSLLNIIVLENDPPKNFQIVLDSMAGCDEFYRELLEDPDFQEITNMSKEEINLLIRAEGENPDAIVEGIRDFASQIKNGNVSDLNDFKRKQHIGYIQDNASFNAAVNDIISSLEEKQDQYLEELKTLCIEEKVKPTKPPRIIRHNAFRDGKAWYQSYTKGMLKNSTSDEILSLLESLRLKKPNLLPLAVSFLTSELENQKKIGNAINNEKLISLVKKKLSSITNTPVTGLCK